MSLSNEWKERIEIWNDELRNHFYSYLGSVEFEGFTTFEQYSLNEALKMEFLPFKTGTSWGLKWEYGWFKSRIVLPKESTGKRIVLKLNLGGEGTVYINGVNAGAMDKEHHEITLCSSGDQREVYDIVVESYAGHGSRIESVSPTPPGRITVPEPGNTQVVVGESTFGIWEEEAYQLWMDADTLYKLRCNIDGKSLRTAEIDKALKEYTLIADFELPYEERIKTFKEARARLKPLLLCVNGSTMPTMFAFGQSHLDLAWMWPLEETKRKCARTLSNQLALMEEYPDYKFFLSQPPIFIMLEKYYPELYGRVKEKVRSGQIMPEGGMWVEADTNLPGGESLIRQFIYGKRFFKEEFGIDSEILWLPDVFGFSAALPQIAKGCGIKYFTTQKINRKYNGGDPFPYNIFLWEGIDGSQILSHIFFKHNSQTDPATVITRWEIQRNQQDDISTFLFSFGYGDGGGGATRNHLEYVRRLKDLEGVPRMKMCHPKDFFKDIEEKGLPENKYVGELYFQAHRGTYTSQAKTKKGNRKSEFALREAEMWSAAAKNIKNLSYPYEALDKVWENVLFNQFHDIIPGTSIQRVHEEAEQSYSEAIGKADAIKTSAVSSLISEEKGITVFNSLSWDRKELIVLPKHFKSVKNSSGIVKPVQTIDGKTFAEVEVPSCGWAVFIDTEEKAEVLNTLKVNEKLLENDLLRVEFNDRGEIVSIYDKETSTELTAGCCNSFKLFKDVTTCYDAWDIDSMYEKLPVELNKAASISVICHGPLIAKLRIERRLMNSLMTQEVSLRRGSRRVEFNTIIDWKESHKLLKVAFPVNYHTEEGIQEIQFGHVKRPNHKSRQYDMDRFEVCNHKWTAVMEEGRGFAVLNDCKYGVNVLDGSINLTLLKSSLVPDMNADKGIQQFTYAFYFWNEPFLRSNLIREAYELNSPVFAVKGSAEEKSIFTVDNSNIIIETVKSAEDRSGDIIIRLYESCRTHTKCNLHLGLPVIKAEQTNMLEEFQRELLVKDGLLQLEFRPFEIKTIRLRFE